MAVAHEVQLGQVVDDLGVDGGLELEVELFEGLSEREVGEAQPGRQTSLAGGVDLSAQHAGQELEMVRTARRGVCGQLGEHLGGADELEVVEIPLDLLDEGGLAHDIAPSGSIAPATLASAAISTGRSVSGCGPMRPMSARSGTATS